MKALSETEAWHGYVGTAANMYREVQRSRTR